MMKHYVVILAIFFQLLILGSTTTYAETPKWKWVPANPPMTLPTLIAKGGKFGTVLAGRASKHIPTLKPSDDYTFGMFFIVLDGKLYRCVTNDGKPIRDGNCFVAVNASAN